MTAHERIEVIEKSFRIFVCGLLSMIPAIGLIPGVYAVFAGAVLYTRHRGDWNPASSYLFWGMNVALATTAVSFFFASLAAIQLL